MKRYKENIQKYITKEMKDFYKKRTKKHIELTQKYCKKIFNFYPKKLNGIMEKGLDHDKSKYKSPEIEPYVLITWDYKCKDDNIEFNLPDYIKDKMNKASSIHVKSNSHHPEFHSSQTDELINREDRDAKPKEIVDATKMMDLDIAEMVADWCAMSEEKGTNTPKEWADKNVDIRWKFTKDQKELVYDLIDKIWSN